MAYWKKILCLASSKKHGGRCIAGKEVIEKKAGAWIRPVSNRAYEEILAVDCSYNGGTYPEPLHVIRVPLERPKVIGHQTENHLIDTARQWQKVGQASFDQALGAIDVLPGPLWQNNFSSSNGINDRIPEDNLGQIQRSLYLVRPKSIRIDVATEGEYFGNPYRTRRGYFTLGGLQYKLTITDPAIIRRFSDLGTYTIKAPILCISLGEIYKGYAYKIIAAVMEEE